MWIPSVQGATIPVLSYLPLDFVYKRKKFLSCLIFCFLMLIAMSNFNLCENTESFVKIWKLLEQVCRVIGMIQEC